MLQPNSPRRTVRRLELAPPVRGQAPYYAVAGSFGESTPISIVALPKAPSDSSQPWVTISQEKAVILGSAASTAGTDVTNLTSRAPYESRNGGSTDVRGEEEDAGLVLRLDLSDYRREEGLAKARSLTELGAFLLTKLAAYPEGVAVDELDENLQGSGWIALARLLRAGLADENDRTVYITDRGEAALSSFGPSDPPADGRHQP
jgi:hypothetical protein